MHWAGLGYSNITPFNTPGEYSEEEIAEALSAFDGIKPLYLAVHCPPLNTKLDEYAPGKHAGSAAVREWVEHEQPAYLFCGHIHETAGHAGFLGATECINVGKQGYTIEFLVRCRSFRGDRLLPGGINNQVAAVARAFAYRAHARGAIQFQVHHAAFARKTWD